MAAGLKLVGCTLILALSLTACTQDGAFAPNASQAPDATLTTESAASTVTASSADVPTGTVVSRQIQQLRTDLQRLQGDVQQHGSELAALRSQTEQNAQQYFMAVAEINARLQTGTTPGNPELVQKWQNASALLENFGANVTAMNGLGSRISRSASMAAFLLESTRATYSLSGAVEQDHVQLANVEDDVNRTVVQIDRVLMDLTGDIERQTAYLANERRNMQMLSLAINNGEAYGSSFASRSFMPAAMPAMMAQPNDLTNLRTTPVPPASKSSGKASRKNVAPASSPTVAPLGSNLKSGAGAGVMGAASSGKPFVVIRFERANIDYGQPLYRAMDQALASNPNASFEIVAVSPPEGNAAQKTLSANEARRHADDVMRTLLQMGMPADRMTLSSATHQDAKVPEVHIFLR